ncbi:hypothetical protein BpHYR1_037724 [Brachionus plicatilis]|uniref:Uncharacterized protein n=1 Tax=Brachionus plicatilis TaxID=10195 RepID=A0A3M7SB05_BRAPC|nr:hypothetical protein BpHYR1_037724 [Brachionus plicatilis]
MLIYENLRKISPFLRFFNRTLKRQISGKIVNIKTICERFLNISFSFLINLLLKPNDSFLMIFSPSQKLFQNPDHNSHLIEQTQKSGLGIDIVEFRPFAFLLLNF